MVRNSTFLFIAFCFFAGGVFAQTSPVTRIWTGGGDGHSWSDAMNWNGVYCTAGNGTIYFTYSAPGSGQIAVFDGVGTLSVTNVPSLVLGNTEYTSGGVNACGSSGYLYSLQITNGSYLTMSGAIIQAGGTASAASGSVYATEALRIDNSSLNCMQIVGNYAQSEDQTRLGMNSIYANNSTLIIGDTTNQSRGGLYPGGNSSFTNCTIITSAFDPYSNVAQPDQKDVYSHCTIKTPWCQFGPVTNTLISNCSIHLTPSGDPQFALNSYTTTNSITLDTVNLDIDSNCTGQLYIPYRQGCSSMIGNITCNSKSTSFNVDFDNGSNINSYPFALTGNLTMNSGSLYLAEFANLVLTGNLVMNGTPDPNYTKQVTVNNNPVFNIGGVLNYANYDGGPYGPIPGGFRSRMTFAGNGDSHVIWPIAFPVDTMIIAKTGCGKVYVDNQPLHVTGKLEADSGQLVLQSNPVSTYSLVDVGDMILKAGGSVDVLNNTAIALGGNFIDSNTTSDPSSCSGFDNLATNPVYFYNTNYSPANRTIGSANTASIGNVSFLSASPGPLTLQNNFSTTDFDFGTNGMVTLGNYNFSVGGTLTNNNASQYFVTNGTGALELKNIGTTSVLFPIGISSTSYTPVTVANTGSTANFSARVQQGVQLDGTTGPALTSQVVDRTWFVEQTNTGPANASVTLQWNGVDELTGFNNSAVYMDHFTGGSWDAGTPGGASGTDPYTFTRSGLTSFSPFAITNSPISLPLDLLSFTAVPAGKTVELGWQTSDEVNTASFQVERSGNGADFAAIGSVAATGASAGAGLTTNYSFADAAPLTGVNAYRLKMIDKDNTFTYSKVLAVSLNGDGLFGVYPNPVHDILYVQTGGSGESAVLELFDATGKRVISQAVIENAGALVQVNIAGLAKGVYYLSLKDRNSSKMQMIVKE